MAAIVENRMCERCDGLHTLCLPTADALDGNREYEYDCPATGHRVRCRPGDMYNRVSGSCPPGAVVLREVGRHG
jgi:hypothetical protein